MLKYPRTPHLPWSQGTRDDLKAISDEDFINRNVVVTEKMDGENTSIYKHTVHARSLEPLRGEEYSQLKALQAELAPRIPEELKICGENLTYKHSIHYKRLRSFFLVHSIWHNTTCMSWGVTTSWCHKLGLQTVPVVYRGVYNRELIEQAYKQHKEEQEKLGEEVEGYVVRIQDSFFHREFDQNVLKFVRPQHVQSSQHWKHTQKTPNIALPYAERSVPNYDGSSQAKRKPPTLSAR